MQAPQHWPKRVGCTASALDIPQSSYSCAPESALAPMCALQAEVCPHSPTTPPPRVTYARISPYLKSPPGGALRHPGRQSRHEHSPNGQRNGAVCGHSLHDSGLDGVSSSPGVDGARGEVAGERNGRGEEGEGAGISIGCTCMDEPQGPRTHQGSARCPAKPTMCIASASSMHACKATRQW